MRIIIEPTKNYEDKYNKPDCIPHRVEIEHPSDDLTISQVIRLMSAALIGIGFTNDNVNEYLKQLSEIE